MNRIHENIRHRHPSEPVSCKSLFQANQEQHLDRHEPT